MCIFLFINKTCWSGHMCRGNIFGLTTCGNMCNWRATWREQHASGGATYHDGEELLEFRRERRGWGDAGVGSLVTGSHLDAGVGGETAAVADEAPLLRRRAAPSLEPQGNRDLRHHLALEPCLDGRNLSDAQRYRGWDAGDWIIIAETGASCNTGKL